MTYYDIRDLSIAGHAVRFVVDGKEVVGHVEFTAAGFPRYRVGSLRRSEKLPKGVIPAKWRPVNPDRWPVRLPHPLTDGAIVEQSEPVAAISDDEPYDPSVRLGRPGETPETPEQVKARIIRCIWTAEVMEYEPGARQETAWLPQLIVAAKVVERAFRSNRGQDLPGFRDQDYDDFYVPDFLPPHRQRFEPTPRDVSDYEHSNGPTTWKFNEAALFRWRSARPIHSWGSIAGILRQPEEVCIAAMEHDCQQILRRLQRRKAA